MGTAWKYKEQNFGPTNTYYLSEKDLFRKLTNN